MDDMIEGERMRENVYAKVSTYMRRLPSIYVYMIASASSEGLANG